MKYNRIYFFDNLFLSLICGPQPMNLKWVDGKMNFWPDLQNLQKSLGSFLFPSLPFCLAHQAAGKWTRSCDSSVKKSLSVRQGHEWAGNCTHNRRPTTLSPRFPGKWRRNNRQFTFAASQLGGISWSEVLTNPSCLSGFEELRMWVVHLWGESQEAKEQSQALCRVASLKFWKYVCRGWFKNLFVWH